jgi:hypothetical protein
MKQSIYTCHFSKSQSIFYTMKQKKKKKKKMTTKLNCLIFRNTYDNHNRSGKIMDSTLQVPLKDRRKFKLLEIKTYQTYKTRLGK